MRVVINTRLKKIEEFPTKAEEKLLSEDVKHPNVRGQELNFACIWIAKLLLLNEGTQEQDERMVKIVADKVYQYMNEYRKEI